MTISEKNNNDSKLIAECNDAHRRSMTGCTVTKGVAGLAFVGDIFKKVVTYSDFNEDNDPHGEHDFGSFEIFAHKIFWKIDYYDENLEKWGDPLDEYCQRVLTIMLADEY